MSLDNRPPDDPARPSGYAVPPLAPEPIVAGPIVPRPRPRGGTRLLDVALGLALVVAVGGVAFAAGRLTAPSPAAASGSNAGGGARGFGNGGFGNGGPRPSGQPGGQGFGGFGGLAGGASLSLTGTVQSIEDGVLTLTTAGGSTVRISVGGSTTYHAQASATPDQVTVGEQVVVGLQGVGRGFRGQGGGQGAAASPAPLGPATDVTIVGTSPAPN